jgi:NosR/NirI family nitrous oxide reductase transcriptional regulator
LTVLSILRPLAGYARWLHTRWPAGTVEPLPEVRDDGSTAVAGLYIAGDLTGIPLLKFAADSGARVVKTILADPAFAGRTRRAGVADLAIVGGGVAGMSAALEARKAGLDTVVLESTEPFSTIVNFPVAKPIFTYPTAMVPAGALRLGAPSRESLLAELQRQTTAVGVVPRRGRVELVRRNGAVLEVVLEGGGTVAAHRVIIAIGRAGEHRRLGVPGEDLDKVKNRLHDPADFAERDVVVVGGGDAALETATAIAAAGGRVTLSYRRRELSRPKAENVEALRTQPSLRVALETSVKEIRPAEVVLKHAEGREETLPNDAVFTMIGRRPPLDLLRRSRVPIRGEWTARAWASLALFLAFCVLVFNWKAGGSIDGWFKSRGWFPFGLPDVFGSPGFWYSLAYCACVVGFGVRRIAKRKTPYVTAQTLTLMAIQVVPLFLLPYLILPWMGRHGWFDAGASRWIADQLFPPTEWDPSGREYWRAFGFVLAWPLFVWNVFSSKPLALWLAISLLQTFVLIPLIVYRWGKGAYCGWICSCGALAETLGDAHRHKMPHGRVWNRLNMTGQVVLAAAFLLAGLRVAAWIRPGAWTQRMFDGMLSGWQPWGVQTNYFWLVDVGLAGVLGVGLYFHFSGRVWCRFACPLAALMHVYARFSTFRILADKKKCISCNVCTSVCHQGIDVMSFANKGLPMEDPQCVRCSACVSSCPTGVLEFGRVDRRGAIISVDTLLASRVRAAEAAVPPREATPSS